MLSHYANRAMSSKPAFAMKIGTVSRWFPKRRFGFVRADNAGIDLFAHATQVAGALTELHVGQRIAFTVGINERTGRHEAQNIYVAN